MTAKTSSLEAVEKQLHVPAAASDWQTYAPRYQALLDEELTAAGVPAAAAHLLVQQERPAKRSRLQGMPQRARSVPLPSPRARAHTTTPHPSPVLPRKTSSPMAPSVPPLTPPITRETLKELDLDAILRNPQLRAHGLHCRNREILTRPRTRPAVRPEPPIPADERAPEARIR